MVAEKIEHNFRGLLFGQLN